MRRSTSPVEAVARATTAPAVNPSAAPAPTKGAILERNRIEYDDAADPYWRLTVYEPSHRGWGFASVAGRRILDEGAARAGLGPGSRALELCSGLGDTCRYLASRHGCRVTGVEINRHQVTRAAARLARLDPEAAARVDYVEADVLDWRPPDRYDLVLAVDALLLLEDRGRALATARAALAPGGLLAVADVFAGPAITERVREYVWSEDGILGLPTPAEQVADLAAGGFVEVETADWTGLAVDCFRRMIDASHRHRDALVAAKGPARYRRWMRNARLYRRWFDRRVLVYGAVFARRRAA